MTLTCYLSLLHYSFAFYINDSACADIALDFLIFPLSLITSLFKFSAIIELS